MMNGGPVVTVVQNFYKSSFESKTKVMNSNTENSFRNDIMNISYAYKDKMIFQVGRMTNP